MVDNLIRAAVEKRRDRIAKCYEGLVETYERCREIGIGLLADLIDPTSLKKTDPDLSREIQHVMESLEFQKQNMDQVANNLQECERLLSDPRAMREFIDRHIGNQKNVSPDNRRKSRKEI